MGDAADDAGKAGDADGIERAVRDALRRVEGEEGPVDLVGEDRIRELEVDDRGEVRFGVALAPGEPARLAEAAREAAASVEGAGPVRVALEPTDDGEPWSSPEPPPASRPAPEEAPDLSGPSPGTGGSADASPDDPGASPDDPAAAPDDGSADDPAPSDAPAPSERADGRSLPVLGSPDSGGGDPSGGSGGGAGGGAMDPDRRAASRDPDEAPPLEGVDRVVAVSSGKGGVGKSTVATNLAAAWADEGLAVGLLDGDVYGPDIPTMFGVEGRPEMEDEAIVPLAAHGVELMSLGFLVDEDTPAIVRGPMLQKIVRQFLRQVRWGELDVLVVDLPPGTGDAQLSLAQLVRLDGGVFVTTPEDVALGGVRKGVSMFERLEVPVLGVVENMSGFACPGCGERHDVFGAGGGERLAGELDLPFLGSIPMGTAVREEGERGVPTVLGRPDAAEATAFRRVAERVRDRLRNQA